jgi:hypothetical protein
VELELQDQRDGRHQIQLCTRACSSPAWATGVGLPGSNPGPSWHRDRFCQDPPVLARRIQVRYPGREVGSPNRLADTVRLRAISHKHAECEAGFHIRPEKQTPHLEERAGRLRPQRQMARSGCRRLESTLAAAGAQSESRCKCPPSRLMPTRMTNRQPLADAACRAVVSASQRELEPPSSSNTKPMPPACGSREPSPCPNFRRNSRRTHDIGLLEVNPRPARRSGAVNTSPAGGASCIEARTPSWARQVDRPRGPHGGASMWAARLSAGWPSGCRRRSGRVFSRAVQEGEA